MTQSVKSISLDEPSRMKSAFLKEHPNLPTTRSFFFNLQITILIFSILLIPLCTLVYWTGGEFTVHDVLGVILVITTLFITACMIYNFPHLFDIRTLRLPGIFVASYSAMILLPLPIAYADFQQRGYYQLTFVAATCAGFLSTLSAILVIDHLFPLSSTKIDQWLTHPIKLSSGVQLLSFLLLLGCLALFGLYIRTVGNLPIIQAIRDKNSVIELALARENALALIRGRIVYIFTTLRSTLFPYTTLLLFVIALVRQRLGSWVLFGIAFIFNLALAAATLEKSPVGYNLIILIFALILVRRKRLSIRWLFLLAGPALIFPIFVVMLTNRFTLEFQVVLFAILRRIFYIPATVISHYFEFIPSHHDYLLGRTMPYISKLFPDGPFPITNVIYLYMFPNSPIRSGTANGAYVSDLWADFGWVGVLFGSFVVGMAIQGLQIIVAKLPKTAPTIVLQAQLSYMVVLLTSVSIFGFLESTGALYASLLTIVILLVSPILRTSR